MPVSRTQSARTWQFPRQPKPWIRERTVQRSPGRRRRRHGGDRSGFPAWRGGNTRPATCAPGASGPTERKSPSPGEPPPSPFSSPPVSFAMPWDSDLGLGTRGVRGRSGCLPPRCVAAQMRLARLAILAAPQIALAAPASAAIHAATGTPVTAVATTARPPRWRSRRDT